MGATGLRARAAWPHCLCAPPMLTPRWALSTVETARRQAERRVQDVESLYEGAVPLAHFRELQTRLEAAEREADRAEARAVRDTAGGREGRGIGRPAPTHAPPTPQTARARRHRGAVLQRSALKGWREAVRRLACERAAAEENAGAAAEGPDRLGGDGAPPQRTRLRQKKPGRRGRGRGGGVET